MDDLQTFILTIFEMISIIIIWNKLEIKVKSRSLWEKLGFIVITSTLTIITSYLPIIPSSFLQPALNILTAYILFRLSIQASAIQYFFILFLLILIQLIFTTPLSLICKEEIYTFRNGLIVNSALLITSIIIYIFVPLQHMKIIYNRQRKLNNFILINIVSVGILILIAWRTNTEYIWQHLIFILIWLLVWIGINIYLAIHTWKLYEQKRKMELHEQYLPFIKNLLEETKRKQHDFKNHLHVIYGIIESNDNERLKNNLKNYLSSLLGSLESIDIALKVENPVLGALLYSKSCEAKMKAIDFRYKIRCDINEFPFQDYEISEILGNLIDNAFEAQESSEFPLREVIFNIDIEDNKKFIEVKNIGNFISSDSIDKIFEKGYSTKQGEHRGYGLYNVKKIVERYHGNLELSLQEKYTSFKILF